MEDVFSGMGQYAYIAAIFIPMLVALVTKKSDNPWLKFGILLVLSAAVGAITIWQTTGTWEWSWTFMLSFVGASEIAYRGLKALFPGLMDKLAATWRSDPVQ